MRSVLLFSIIALLFFCECGWAAGGNLGNGDGSQGNPYLIEDFTDFQEFRSNNVYWSSGVYTKLMCDIDLDPTLEGRRIYNRAIIAKDTSDSSGFQGTAFGGIFDGNDHVVRNLVIDTAGDNKDYLGLFGQIRSSGEVKKLGVENVDIVETSTVNVSRYFGGLCGANYGHISNCYVTGSLSGIYTIGGLCGINSEGFISNCYTDCIVTGNHTFGGLCGLNTDFGEIKDCYAIGSVIGEESFTFGGLCGLNKNIGYIKDCYAIGSVTGGEGCAEFGGLCGDNSGGYYAPDFGPGYIENCYADVVVIGGRDCISVGGLCGINSGGIVDCYSLGSVTAGGSSGSIGGLCGYASNVISKSYAATPVIAGTHSGNVGGFCGTENGAYFHRCFWDKEVSGMTIGIGYQNPSPQDLTGVTTVQMQTQSTFTDAGWEFADFEVGLRGWYMPESGYPKLDWQNQNASYVPNVANLPIDQACSQLTSMGLSVGEKVYIKSWKTPIGIAAGISVYASGYVDKSHPIDIFASSGTSGDGSETNPYEIASKEDLEAVNTALSAYYIMTADIYFSHDDYYNGSAVIAPATRYYPFPYTFLDEPFSGRFDGDNHIIGNLEIAGSGATQLGLFGCVGPNGAVTNLGIKNCLYRIYGSQGVGGILCGQNNGQINNCYVANSLLNVTGPFMGGLCGDNRGGIENCYVADTTVETYQAYNVGLFCGVNYGGTITDCYSIGLVDDQRSSRGIGGLCGMLYGGVVNNCYSVYSLKENSRTEYFGGLYGYYREGTVENCFWDIDVSQVYNGVGNLDYDPNGILGKTTPEMQLVTTFTDAGWDFESIWWIDEGNDYPRLWWEFTNTAPIADAGGNQTIYAFVDGYALVELDGTGSTDADGDVLEYFWYDDANELIATGIEPNVVLPVGDNQIKLIVNDGIEDSEPNSCVVTVIEALRTEAKLTPQTLNHKNHQPHVIGRLELAGFNKLDFAPDVQMVLLPGAIAAERVEILPGKNKDGSITLMGFFDHASLIEEIAKTGEAEVTIGVRLLSGQWVYGTDVIKVK